MKNKAIVVWMLIALGLGACGKNPEPVYRALGAKQCQCLGNLTEKRRTHTKSQQQEIEAEWKKVAEQFPNLDEAATEKAKTAFLASVKEAGCPKMAELLAQESLAAAMSLVPFLEAIVYAEGWELAVENCACRKSLFEAQQKVRDVPVNTPEADLTRWKSEADSLYAQTEPCRTELRERFLVFEQMSRNKRRFINPAFEGTFEGLRAGGCAQKAEELENVAKLLPLIRSKIPDDQLFMRVFEDSF